MKSIKRHPYLLWFVATLAVLLILLIPSNMGIYDLFVALVPITLWGWLLIWLSKRAYHFVLRHSKKPTSEIEHGTTD